MNRIRWIDAARGIGIILVVVGHTMRGLTASGVLEPTSVILALDAWIYSFHMPLFFFLAGLFFFKPAASSLPLFVSDKVRTIAYPYMVWSIVTVLLKAPLGQISNSPHNLSDLPQILYAPIDQFWFLYVLFVLAVLFGAMYAAGVKPWIAGCIALLIYAAPIDSGWSVLHQAKSYAVFVALGSVAANRLMAAETLPAPILAGIAALGLGLPAVLIWYQAPELLSAIGGIAGVVALATLLSRSDALVFLGKHSLEIFVVHTMASASVRVILLSLHVQSASIYIVTGVLAGLLLPLCLINFRSFFIFPKQESNMKSTIAGGFALAMLFTTLALWPRLECTGNSPYGPTIAHVFQLAGCF